MGRAAVVLVVVTLLGCGARSVADDGAPSAEGVACGAATCTGADACVVQGDDARCAPGAEGPDALLVRCDDDGDCDEGERCEWLHAGGAGCEPPPPGGDCAMDVPRQPACRVDDDCPPCSLGCYAVNPALDVGRCEYPR